MNENAVICALDVNDFDQQTVDLAAQFAKQFEVDLDLLNVTLFPDPAAAGWPMYLGSPQVMIEEHRRLKAITTQVPGVNVKHHHLFGAPVEKVVGFVAHHQPRLLVLGTHQRRGLRRIFGSVATQILRRVTCPVMILRQRQQTNSEPPIVLTSSEAETSVRQQ